LYPNSRQGEEEDRKEAEVEEVAEDQEDNMRNNQGGLCPESEAEVVEGNNNNLTISNLISRFVMQELMCQQHLFLLQRYNSLHQRHRLHQQRLTVP